MLMNPSHQLGFRRYDSTETLLLRLLSDFCSTLEVVKVERGVEFRLDFLSVAKGEEH